MKTRFWHFNCCLGCFDWFGRRCREKLNEKSLLLFATLGCSISWAPTYATTIAIDLGPPGRVTGEKIVSFNDSNDIQFSGQTLSLDLVFSGNGFVRLFKSTNSTFLLIPMLDVFGAGTINNPTGSGYLI